MKFPPSAFLLKHFVLATVVLASTAQAQYLNGQNAATVLGQPSFTTNAVPPSASATLLNAPNDVAVDPTTGKVFVADTGFNRVLRFSSEAAVASGTSAEYVFGQSDFVSSDPGNGDEELNRPNGVFVDSTGRLWVADTNNARVLYFDAAAEFSGTPTATGQLGTGTAGITNQQLSAPYDMVVSSTGAAYVADRGNNRVLRFSTPTTSGIADGLFGQSNYLADNAPADQSGMSSPSNVELDSSGNLWVSDTGHNRVLRFSDASSALAGAQAASVLGQTTLTGTGAGTTASSLRLPTGLAIDPVGRLYVADYNNNRLLIFNASDLSSSGSSASFVLGQSTYTTSSALPVSQSSLSQPGGISYSVNRLWVADMSNNRVLSYSTQPGNPALSTSPRKPKLNVGVTKNIGLVIRNSSANSDAFTVKVTTQKNFSGRGRIKYLFNNVDVTSSIKAGTFTTPQVSSNGSTKIILQMRALKGSSGKLNLTGYATSVTDTTVTTKRAIAVKIVQP